MPDFIARSYGRFTVQRYPEVGVRVLWRGLGRWWVVPRWLYSRMSWWRLV